MRTKNFQKASDLFDQIIPDKLKQKTFIHNNIFNNWKQIVGEDISEIIQPYNLKFLRYKITEATLTLEVNEMLVHQAELLENQIIQRINFFFGLNAVMRLKFKKKIFKN